MHCNFFVLCEYAAQMANGSPSLHGIFRHIVASVIPSVLDPFYIAFEIEADHHETDQAHEFTLRMIDQDGGVYFEQRLEAHFGRRPGMGPVYVYFFQRIHIQRPIEHPGVFRFDLTSGDIPIDELRFEILQARPG